MLRLFCIDEKLNEFNKDICLNCNEQQITDTVKKITLTFTNKGDERKLAPAIEYAYNGKLSFYMIPCVMYNGNEFGQKQEPAEIFVDGKPWIFSADRTGIPACTIAETRNFASAFFAGNDCASANSSGSIYEKDGKIIQRIYFAHIEAPKTYAQKYEFTYPIIEIPTIKAGESKQFTCYLYEFEKANESDCYGYNGLFDFINESYYTAYEPKYSLEQVKEFNRVYLRSLLEETPNGLLSNMGYLPDGEHKLGDKDCVWMWRKGGKYQSGWCGQNFLIAELFLRDYLQTNNPKDKEIAKSILTTWMQRRHKNGLISAYFDAPFNDEEEIDTCNIGWVAYELLQCSELLKKCGEEVEIYENSAKRILDFFLTNFPEGNLPQVVNGAGKVLVTEGGAGTVLLMAITKAYAYIKEEKYLSLAKKVFNFYYNTYLSKSISAGGALDTYCIDKESAGPLLRAGISLYKQTGNNAYLQYCENIAHYLMSWCYYHNVPFDKESDCAKVDLKTLGGTSVSVSHHHIDCWGLFYIPEMFDLYELTGKIAYKNHAHILWLFTQQYISDGTLVLHGMKRAIGMQNEAVFQCNWGFESVGYADYPKGLLNDWMVAWVKAFEQSAVYYLESH